MAAGLYNRDILRLASTLPPGDRLDHADGVAESRSPVCGSRITAEITLAADGSITALALKANACALGQASAAILRANAVGETLSSISDIRSALAGGLSDIGAMPENWPDLALLAAAKDYPSRHAAILLPYDALLAAAQNAKLAI